MIRTIVVEDEYFVRVGFIAAMPWERFGIRIVGEAGNGKKAIELLEREPVDLIITDLAMPHMNGFELMRYVREHYPAVHLAVLTCHEDFKYIQDALRCGALDYIVKTEIEGGSMEQSLQRIVRCVEGKGGTSARGAEEGGAFDPSEWAEGDGQRLQAHIDRWLPLGWVTNDHGFASLRTQLDELRPPLPELQKAFHYLMVEWSRIPGIGSMHEWSMRSSRLKSRPQWDAFIGELRAFLRGTSLFSKYPEDIVARVLQAKEWIKTEMDAGVTQSYIAAKLRMSRGHFSKCFREIVGEPFNDYLKANRIARARMLLRQSAKPVADIAELCGFQDARYFSRQFREATGLLPSEFRNRPS